MNRIKTIALFMVLGILLTGCSKPTKVPDATNDEARKNAILPENATRPADIKEIAPNIDSLIKYRLIQRGIFENKLELTQEKTIDNNVFVSFLFERFDNSGKKYQGFAYLNKMGTNFTLEHMDTVNAGFKMTQ